MGNRHWSYSIWSSNNTLTFLIIIFCNILYIIFILLFLVRYPIQYQDIISIEYYYLFSFSSVIFLGMNDKYKLIFHMFGPWRLCGEHYPRLEINPVIQKCLLFLWGWRYHVGKNKMISIYCVLWQSLEYFALNQNYWLFYADIN